MGVVYRPGACLKQTMGKKKEAKTVEAFLGFHTGKISFEKIKKSIDIQHLDCYNIKDAQSSD